MVGDKRSYMKWKRSTWPNSLPYLCCPGDPGIGAAFFRTQLLVLIGRGMDKSNFFLWDRI